MHLLNYFSSLPVFFEVFNDGENITEFIALTKGGMTFKKMIVLNGRYVFSGLKKCSWKRSKAANSKKIVTDEVVTTTESTVHWYIGDDNCVVVTCSKELAESQRIHHSHSVVGAEELLTALHETECSEMVQPSTTYLKDLFSSKEIMIEGTISSLNPSGWIELLLLNPVLPGHKSRIMNVFIIHYSRSDTTDKLLKGMKVRISFVFPIYLWGKLKGCAATVRSHVEIVDSCCDQTLEYRGEDVRAKIPRKRDRNDLSSSSTSCGGKNEYAVDLTDCETISNVAIDSRTAPSRLTVPQELRTRCHMFAAWRAYLEKKYTMSVSQSPILPRYDARSLNSKNKAIRNYINDRVAVLPSEFLRIMEQGRGRGRAFPESCQCNLHKADNSTIYCDCSEELAASYIPNMTLLPPTRSVQEEFMSSQYTELYTIRYRQHLSITSLLGFKSIDASKICSNKLITHSSFFLYNLLFVLLIVSRAGHDADWLCAQFSQVKTF